MQVPRSEANLQLLHALAAGCVGALASAAYAGPPFVTDDPEPVEYHAWEVNYALTGVRDAGGTMDFLPQIDANYEPAPGVQLHVQPQAAYSRVARVQAHGIGDTELGLKRRLTPEPEGEEAWMVSAYPLYEVPTGNARRKLGAGFSSTYLPLWAQRSFGGWTVYGGGYWFDPGAGNRNAWAGGWVALYRWNERLQLGGEWYGKTADTAGASGSSRFDLGGTLRLAKDYSLLFSAGRGLGNAAATDVASFYLGL